MLKRFFFRLLGRPGAHSAGPRRRSSRAGSEPTPTAPRPPEPVAPEVPERAAPEAPEALAPPRPVGSRRVKLIMEDGSEMSLPPDPVIEARAAYLTRSLMAPPPPAAG